METELQKYCTNEWENGNASKMAKVREFLNYFM